MLTYPLTEDAELRQKLLDGGALPGIPSTVVDLSRYEAGEWRVLREGAMPIDRLARVLA